MAESCRFYSYEGGIFSNNNVCSVRGKREYVTEDYYRRYCSRDYNSGACPLYKKYGPYQSGCFITTVIHHILGNSDSCKVLNDFRKFRDTILQKNPKYYEGLKEYDSIGPMVASSMVHDKDSYDMAVMTYELDLLRVHQFYLEGKYDDAYDWYCKMTRDLISYYGLDHEYAMLKANGYDYDDFCPSKAGHGMVKSLVKRC